MGIMKKQAATAGSDGPPWFLPSGVWAATLEKIVTKPERECGIYTLSFLPVQDKVKSAPTPLHVPTLHLELDANDANQMAILYAIVGKPMRDGIELVWDDTGLCRWNGKTDENQRTSGAVELEVKSKAPNPKQSGGGWWEAKYEIEDVSPIGEAQRKADEMANNLLNRSLLPGTGDKSLPSPPPVKAKGK